MRNIGTVGKDKNHHRNNCCGSARVIFAAANDSERITHLIPEDETDTSIFPDGAHHIKHHDRNSAPNWSNIVTALSRHYQTKTSPTPIPTSNCPPTLPSLELPTATGGAASVPAALQHFKTRPITSLSTSNDSKRLSEFNCFLRSECLEIFVANAEDMKVRRESHEINMNQVGVRCRFCAHIEHTKRRKRSTAFPLKLSNMYESVDMMAKDHFPMCTEMPVDVNTQLSLLKVQEGKKFSQCKEYWEESACHLGMRDGPSTGVFMIPTLLSNDEFAAFVLGAFIKMVYA